MAVHPFAHVWWIVEPEISLSVTVDRFGVITRVRGYWFGGQWTPAVKRAVYNYLVDEGYATRNQEEYYATNRLDPDWGVLC